MGSEYLEVLRIAQSLLVDLVGVRMVSEQLRGLLTGQRSEVVHLQKTHGRRPRDHFREPGRKLSLPVGHEAQHSTCSGRLKQLLHVRELVRCKEVEVLHHGQQRTALGCACGDIADVLQVRAAGVGGRGVGPPTSCAHRYSSGSCLGRDGPHESAFADAWFPDERDDSPRPLLESGQGSRQRLDFGLSSDQRTYATTFLAGEGQYVTLQVIGHETAQ
ncbi:hypothetical protein Scel_80320 [Streptomyces cellostaticus]|nr:hypothetical protein Scel_80320 [Streptomyces cellostaticus]